MRKTGVNYKYLEKWSPVTSDPVTTLLREIPFCLESHTYMFNSRNLYGLICTHTCLRILYSIIFVTIMDGNGRYCKFLASLHVDI